jgi:HemK-related putative methylase
MLTQHVTHPALTLPRYGVAGAAIGKLQYRIRKWLGHCAYDEFMLERVEGRRILVLPTVFNPRALRTGAFFAAQLAAGLPAHSNSVLDMGTGSGVCAIACAGHAQRIVAVDINPAAVRCARINALINKVESRVEVHEGDLFAPIGDERFDLILFNPPFIRATPSDARDRAWRATDVMERFAENLHAHLTPGGCALVLLSTFGDAPSFLARFDAGWSVELWAQREFVNETVAIFQLQRRL